MKYKYEALFTGEKKWNILTLFIGKKKKEKEIF